MTEPDPLQRLLASADGPTEPEVDALEQFVAAQLAAAGEWESARTSDGISTHRIVERGPQRVVVAGQIWSIDQALHAFCLIIEGGGWRLLFDIVNPREARNAMHLDHPEELPWRLTLVPALTP